MYEFEHEYGSIVDSHTPLQPGIEVIKGLGEYTLEDIRDLRKYMTPVEKRDFDSLLKASPPVALMPHQEIPWHVDWWDVAVLQGGRGVGKTNTGAFACRQHLRALGPKARIGVGAPTQADARDTCAEGPTGLITLFENEFPRYNRSLGEAHHIMGGFVKFMGTEKPARWNGPAWSLIWWDELALCNPKAWADMMPGLRLGPKTGPHRARAIATTTPKAAKWVRLLTREKTTYLPLYHLDKYRNGRVIYGPEARLRDPRSGPIQAVTAEQWKQIEKQFRPPSTYDNPNLPEARVRWLQNKYGGTRLGQQELEGLFIEDVEGAMWKRDWILHETDESNWPRFLRIVVAIDPAGTAARSTSDENKKEDPNERRNADTAIAVVAKGSDGNIYVLALMSDSWTPEQWASKAIQLFHDFRADKIIAEKNFGGLMVESTIKNAWRQAPVKLINASRGKDVRAEPVAFLYEKRQVKHVRHFPDAESQMCAFINSNENEGADLVDANVWGISELMGWTNPGTFSLTGPRDSLNKFQGMLVH